MTDTLATRLFCCGPLNKQTKKGKLRTCAMPVDLIKVLCTLVTRISPEHIIK